MQDYTELTNYIIDRTLLYNKDRFYERFALHKMDLLRAAKKHSDLDTTIEYTYLEIRNTVYENTARYFTQHNKLMLRSQPLSTADTHLTKDWFDTCLYPTFFINLVKNKVYLYLLDYLKSNDLFIINDIDSIPITIEDALCKGDGIPDVYYGDIDYSDVDIDLYLSIPAHLNSYDVKDDVINRYGLLITSDGYVDCSIKIGLQVNKPISINRYTE